MINDKYDKAVSEILDIIAEPKGNGILPEAETDQNVLQVEPHVELLSYTMKPLETVNVAARRCYSDLSTEDLVSDVLGKEDDELGSFINGVMKTGHMSTIEHAAFTFIVEGVSRALLAQITRSRIASFSVLSQRYVKMDDGMTYVIPPAIMDLGDEAMAEYAAQMCTMHQWYMGWRAKGIEPEDARFVTPQAVETRFIVTMNARELFHLFSLRICDRSQWEINFLAEEMLSECQMACPELFKKAGPSCVQSGKCPEGKRSCGKIEEQKAKFSALYKLNKTVHDSAGCDYFPMVMTDLDSGEAA